MKVLLTLVLLTMIVSGCGDSRKTAQTSAEQQVVPDELRRMLQGRWLAQIHTHDLGTVETVFQFQTKDDGKVNAHSREGALADLVGGWKSFLARTFSSGYENGAFLHIDAQALRFGREGVQMEGTFSSPIGKLRLQLQGGSDSLVGTLSASNKRLWGRMRLQRFDGAFPLRNYRSLPEAIRQMTATHIYNPSLLDRPEWREFWEKLDQAAKKAQDDIDFLFAFSRLAGEVHISHFNLWRTLDVPLDSGSVEEAHETPDLAELEFPAPNIGYLRIRHFPIDLVTSIDSLFLRINERNPEVLVIDLRDNPGGTLSSMRVAQHLVTERRNIGVFLSNLWWRTHNALPSPEEYRHAPILTNYDLLDFQSVLRREGWVTAFVEPLERPFPGKVYVLINGNTASACEPLVAFLQENGLATVVGEQSAGYMLSSDMISLEDGWLLRLPVADYYTANGQRLEGRGVIPDIPAPSDAAFDSVLARVDR